MIRMGSALAGFCLVTQFLVAGEVSYQETTKITGGSMTSMMKFAGAFSKDARKLGQPVVTTIAVKDNRMAHINQDSSEITDLDARTMTHIDKLKHEYSVVTFAQMKEAMQRAMEKAKTEAAKAPSQPATATQPVRDPNMQLNFETHVRKTGATRQVSGIDTNEIILTLAVNGTDKSTGQQGAMAVTNDMWMAPAIPAQEEVREFQRRLALEMGSMFTAGPDLSGLVQQAQSNEALKAMAKEMSQIQGVPVLQVMRMGMTTDGKALPAASEAPLPDSGAGPGMNDAVGAEIVKASEDTARQTAAQETTQRIRGALGSSLGSAIGGFGGFGRKKKQPATQETTASNASSPQTGSAPTQAVLIESVTELSNFTQHVDRAMLEVPAGFKLVVAPELK